MDIQQKLINDCIKRDAKAEYQLYKLTYRYLMSICIRYTRQEDRAKEVLNIGFLKILTHLDKFRPEMPFNMWIRKIMINTIINEYRKEEIHYSKMEYVEDYFEDEKYVELNEAIERSDLKDIYRLVDQLAPSTRQVFTLYFVDGYKHREIAELLNITESTSKWHVNSAREKLREALKKTIVDNVK